MELTGPDFVRLANNFYVSKGLSADYSRIALDADLSNYIVSQKLKKYKVAFLWICLNERYWEFAKTMVEGARQYFLPGHETDFFLWSDMPEEINYGATVFPTEPIEWPMPTLMRYHLFLQQEELLEKYDYIFYSDVDMKFVGIVGDEILGEGLTVAPHPGYYVRKQLYPPFEPNPESSAYIDRPGFLANDGGQPRFMPFYAAGGFQGGTAKAFIKAMKEMRRLIDKDFGKNYIPIWNDESIFNKYLFSALPKAELTKTVFLTPSYIYPDSLIKEFYEPIVWGQSFSPKIITLTKKFSVSKEGADAITKMIQ